MKTLLIILAAYVFVGWNDANAGCQRFKPDGTVEECQHLVDPPPSDPGAMCQIGVMLAHRAYVAGTFDAQLPDLPKLHYLVDFYGDQVSVAHDRRQAHAAVEYIARRMQKAGVRTPRGSPVMMQAEREFLVRECHK